MPTPLTDFQATCALHLARVHHHLWATLQTVPDEQVIEWLVGGRLDLLEAACLEQGAGQPGGITPVIGDDGGHAVVTHTTGTGRLSWSVWPDGVIISAHRADGPVLTASGDASDWVDRTMSWTLCDADGDTADAAHAVDVLPRHLDAIEHALGYPCTDTAILGHVRDSAARELDRAREGLREAGEVLVKASIELALQARVTAPPIALARRPSSRTAESEAVAWDEGWAAGRDSHGVSLVEAFRAGAEYMRRSASTRLHHTARMVVLPDAERVQAAAEGYVSALEVTP